MIQKMKMAVLFSATALAFCQLPAAETNQAKTKISDAELFPDKVLARGKNIEVKQSELENAFISYKSGLAARGLSLPEDKRESIESELLNQLVIDKILQQRATPEDKTVAHEKANKALDEIKKQLPADDFKQRIRATGMSEESVRERLTSDAVQRMVVDRELKDKIKISDEEVKKFYTDNETKFDRPEMVHVAHILILTQDKETQKPMLADKKKEKEEQIKKIKARADAGEDFGKLVAEFSEDPGSKTKGGEYTFARAKDDPKRAMVPEFEKAAFALKPGQISDVVETEYGYHIIKLLEKKPAGKDSLEEASKDIREVLIKREMEKQLPEYFKKIKSEAGVELVGQKPNAAK